MAKDEAAPKADEVKASGEQADEQESDKEWPVPGDEGFVHPDGTPQAVGQLADNERAAADRDAIGSVVHGAPLATPGPQADLITSAKVEQAAKVEGNPDDEGNWVDKSLAETAAKVADDTKAN